MRIFAWLAFVAACHTPTIGTADVTRGDQTIARAAYAGRVDAILNGVPTTGWVLFLSPNGVDGRTCSDVALANYATKIALYTNSVGSDLPTLPAGDIALSSASVTHVPQKPVGEYTDIDHTWDLEQGTLTLDGGSDHELSGTLAGSCASSGTSVDLAGTFVAPLCDQLRMQFSYSGN